MPSKRTRNGTRYWYRGDSVMMWISCAVFLFMALGGAQEYADTPWAAAVVVTPVVAIAVGAARAALRVGVISDERGLVVRWVVGEATVDWNDVHAFALARMTESGVITVSKVGVVAELADGERLALPLSRRDSEALTALREELAWSRTHDAERLRHPSPPAISRFGQRQMTLGRDSSSA